MSDSSGELLAQIHARLFKILCDIDDYCRANKIVYFLSGGTCLGAARHHGFIPWDDDADIMMPRKEYEKLIKGFQQAYREQYRVLALETDDTWPVPRGKIEDIHVSIKSEKLSVMGAGFAVDIFPIDGLPDQEWKQLFQDFIVRVILVLRNATIRKEFFSYEKYRLLKRFLGAVLKLFGVSPRKMAEKIDRISKRYDVDASKFVAVRVTTHYGVRREKLNREDISSAVYLEFEGREFPVMNGYKKYLSNLYGADYMKIPTDPAITGYTHLEGARIEINNE